MKKPTEEPKMTMKAVYAYLSKHGIPKNMVQQIQIALIYDAVTQGEDIKYDRIYSGIALALRKEFGWGPERITRVLRRFDDLCGSVLDKDADGDDLANWNRLMQELKDETGLVIHTGDDDRLVCEVSRD